MRIVQGTGVLARVAWRVAACGLLAATVVILAAKPASAHGLGGLQPTNYRTVLRGLTPHVRGIQVRTVNSGTKIELRNSTTTPVTVFGYSGEPYLRVGPGGVYENVLSPAVFLNRSVIPTVSAPPSYNAAAPPRWHRISTVPLARWHDHRSHWMGSSDPPIVSRAPGERHVVIADFEIPLRYGNEVVALHGDVDWIPGPSPFPWVAAAVILGACLAGLARSARWRWALVAALAVVSVTGTVQVIGAWNATTAGIGSRLSSNGYAIGGVAVAVIAVVWLLRSDPWGAIPAVLVAGVFVTIAGGIADITALSRSQIPTTIEPTLARCLVVISLGFGAGLVIAAAVRLRRPAPAAAQNTGP